MCAFHPDDIEQAFKQYFRTPEPDGRKKWFPEECDILTIISGFREIRRKRREQQEAEAQAAKDQEMLARGECMSWAEVAREIKRLIDQREADEMAKKGKP